MKRRRIRFRTAAQDCLKILEATKSASTVRMYTYAIRLFVVAAYANGYEYVDQLTIDDFIAYAGNLAVTQKATSTRRVYLSGVTFFMNWLITMGSWEASLTEMKRYENACKQWVGKPRSPKPMIPPEDIEQVIDEARKHTDTIQGKRNVAIVLLLYSSGMRVGELVNLKIGDFHFPNRSVQVTGKGDKTRITFFSKETSLAVQSYWHHRGTEFPATYLEGQPAFPLTTSSIRRIVAKLATNAGFCSKYITPHTFRHAFAIKMLQNNSSLALIQDLLGHASPATTRVYARFAPETLREQYEDAWE